MEQIDVKLFDYLKNNFYGNPEVYFSCIENCTIISVPAWNWCYLWDVKKDNAKENCVKALSVPMHEEHAKEFAEVIYNYLFKKGGKT